METKNKAKQLFHRLPSRLKFGIMQYVVMNLFLVVLNYATSPQCWWAGWVALGWGLSLLLKLISWYYICLLYTSPSPRDCS